MGEERRIETGRGGVGGEGAQEEVGTTVGGLLPGASCLCPEASTSPSFLLSLSKHRGLCIGPFGPPLPAHRLGIASHRKTLSDRARG